MTNSEKPSAVDKVAKASSRLESVCQALLKAHDGLDKELTRELSPMLQDLEKVHMQIVGWVAKKRNISTRVVMFPSDIRKVLRT